jgi:hypothetical protein
MVQNGHTGTHNTDTGSIPYRTSLAPSARTRRRHASPLIDGDRRTK